MTKFVIYEGLSSTFVTTEDNEAQFLKEMDINRLNYDRYVVDDFAVGVSVNMKAVSVGKPLEYVAD